MNLSGMRKAMLALLIAHTPFMQGNGIGDFFDENGLTIGLSLGLSLVTTVTTALLITRSSVKQGEEAKAQLQRAQADITREEQANRQLSLRNKELEHVLSQEHKEQEQRKKLDKQRIELENAERFAQAFADLHKAYSSQSPEALAQDSSFQGRLEALVMGTNPHPQRLEMLSEKIGTSRGKLIKIDPANLTPEDVARRESILNMLSWVERQANNSHVIYTTQQEMMRNQLELEQATHLARIATEHEARAKIETESAKNVCTLQEEAAKRLNLTTIQVEQQAGRIARTLDEGLYTIERTIRERLDMLNAWQANRAQEHAETRAQFNALQMEYAILRESLEQFKALCTALTHTSESSHAKLDSIERKEVSLNHQLQAFAGRMNNIERALTTLGAQLKQQPQTTASVPQSEYDKNLFDAYKPAREPRPEDEE